MAKVQIHVKNTGKMFGILFDKAWRTNANFMFFRLVCFLFVFRVWWWFFAQMKVRISTKSRILHKRHSNSRSKKPYYISTHIYIYLIVDCVRRHEHNLSLTLLSMLNVRFLHPHTQTTFAYIPLNSHMLVNEKQKQTVYIFYFICAKNTDQV